MSFAEQWKREHRDAVSQLTFSQALDEYLDMRTKGPNDGHGYTDKNHEYRLEALRWRMDVLAPAKPSATHVAQESPRPKAF